MDGRVVKVRINNESGTEWTLRNVKKVSIRNSLLYVSLSDQTMTFPLQNLLWWTDNGH